MDVRHDGNAGGRRLALLALQRLGFLKTTEKLILVDLLDSGLDLSLLCLSDVESAIGRRLRNRTWDFAGLLDSARADALLVASIGARYVNIADPDFPAALREIPEPPFGLYERGGGFPAGMPALGVVGTRYPTGAGLEACLAFAAGLASCGLPIVSGLARGIDSAAHRGALEAGGFTCAVLPCGIETVYPAGNRALAASILASGGLLVTEYPPGTAIQKSRFPERNRIISGLCRGLLVVEAPADSGALITANFALEQGRDVYVAASQLGSPQAAGIDLLASEGAKPILKAEEVLEDWALAAGDRPSWWREKVPAGREGGDRGESPDCAYTEGSAVEGFSLAVALRAELLQSEARRDAELLQAGARRGTGQRFTAAPGIQAGLDPDPKRSEGALLGK
jgi:DNA processing protein